MMKTINDEKKIAKMVEKALLFDDKKTVTLLCFFLTTNPPRAHTDVSPSLYTQINSKKYKNTCLKLRYD